MNDQQIIAWLLEGDVAIQYQVWRDLLGKDKKNLQSRIETEGWGKKILAQRKPEGHWGDRFYQPKWISTHYTLLDLRNLNLPPDNAMVKDSIANVLQNDIAYDGGIRLGPSTDEHSDVCVNAMFLNYASYFETPEKKLHSIVNSILNELMPDGGFNCRTARSGSKHSSLHSTISVLEGFAEFQKAGYTYRKENIKSAIRSSIEFLLLHQLFISDHTGEVIKKDFLRFTYPCRWKYDIMRALDFFQYAGIIWDSRMEASMQVIKEKRNRDNTWNNSAAHAGQVHVTMEKAGNPGRWNTLRALRILIKYNGNDMRIRT